MADFVRKLLYEHCGIRSVDRKQLLVWTPDRPCKNFDKDCTIKLRSFNCAQSTFSTTRLLLEHHNQTSADSAVRILSGTTVRCLSVKIKFKFEIRTLENPPDRKFQILTDRHRTVNPGRIRTELSADVWCLRSKVPQSKISGPKTR